MAHFISGEQLTTKISAHSIYQHSELFQATKAVLICDKIGAQHPLAVQSFDNALRNVRGIDRLFGGFTTLLSGELLPALDSAPFLWQDITVLHLKEVAQVDSNSTGLPR